MRRPRIALVSREVYPFGAGIGTYVGALAGFLEVDAEVTVFTSSGHREDMEREAVRQRLLFGNEVKLVYVEEPEPDEVGSYLGHMHCYSARVLDALREMYGPRGPDLIEFQDYLAEGVVSIQARATHDSFLVDTPIIVRLDTTSEMCAVLDGAVDASMAAELLHSLERYCLRFADRLVYGGGDIYASYVRVYGRQALAPGILLRQPLGPDGPIAATSVAPPVEDGPLRILYVGRLESRKGVAELVSAMSQLYRHEVHLTLVGRDTDSAPLRTSMAGQLSQMVGSRLEGDQGPFEGDRFADAISLVPHLTREDLLRLIDGHHVGIFPSLWECWPASTLEVLSRNRPVIGTPVGGLAEMVQPGRSGWLARDTSADALAETIGHVAASRAEMSAMIDSGGPRTVHDELCDGDAVAAFYRSITAGSSSRALRRRNVKAAACPLVSVIVPYFRMSRYVEQTVASLLRQTYSQMEIILVNDGSFEPPDRLVARLAKQLPIRVVTGANSGLGAARNLGISVSRGRFVLMLDSDDTVDPKFVELAITVLLNDPSVAYVSSWSQYTDDAGAPGTTGYQPVSNFLPSVERGNVAGTCTAMFRRSLFDTGYAFSEALTSYEDWDLYRRLRSARLYGHCIPKRLLRYRVRDGSMLREVGLPEVDRLHQEMTAHERMREVTWTKSMSD